MIAGGVVSTGRDMGKFLKLLFRQDAAAYSTPTQVLDGKTIREWLTEPVFANPTVVEPNTMFFDCTPSRGVLPRVLLIPSCARVASCSVVHAVGGGSGQHQHQSWVPQVRAARLDCLLLCTVPCELETKHVAACTSCCQVPTRDKGRQHQRLQGGSEWARA